MAAYPFDSYRLRRLSLRALSKACPERSRRVEGLRRETERQIAATQLMRLQMTAPATPSAPHAASVDYAPQMVLRRPQPDPPKLREAERRRVDYVPQSVTSVTGACPPKLHEVERRWVQPRVRWQQHQEPGSATNESPHQHRTRISASPNRS